GKQTGGRCLSTKFWPEFISKRRDLQLSLLKTPSAHFPSQLRQKSPRETEDGRLSAVSQIRWPAYHSRTNNKPGPDPAADLDPKPKLRGPPFVTMMETADFGNRNYFPERLYRVLGEYLSNDR